MIAVDTNVLLRRLLDDDAEQSAKARRLFGMSAGVLITDVSLVETIWVLTGKRYKANREHIVAMLTSLLEEPNVLFESRQAIWSALNEYANTTSVSATGGAREVDFADALIVSKAKATASHLGTVYGGTYTFDQAALSLDGTKAL